jgi:hypothetical protein
MKLSIKVIERLTCKVRHRVLKKQLDYADLAGQINIG